MTTMFLMLFISLLINFTHMKNEKTILFTISTKFLAAKAQLNTCTCVASVCLWSKLNFSRFTPPYAPLCPLMPLCAPL